MDDNLLFEENKNGYPIIRTNHENPALTIVSMQVGENYVIAV